MTRNLRNFEDIDGLTVVDWSREEEAKESWKQRYLTSLILRQLGSRCAAVEPCITFRPFVEKCSVARPDPMSQNLPLHVPDSGIDKLPQCCHNVNIKIAQKCKINADYQTGYHSTMYI